MRFNWILLLTVSIPLPAFSQDVKVREEAVILLEHADRASSTPDLPNLERVDTFRVFAGEPAVREGSFSRVVIQGTGRRDESSFGSYHVVNFWSRKGVAISGAPTLRPPELVTLMQIAPIQRLQFNGEDVIRSVVSRSVDGHAARCIEFDTVAGQKTEQNEVCVDSASGVFLSQKLGDELVEYGEFFPFSGGLMPGKISYSFAGVLKMEVTQTMTVLGGDAKNVLSAPPDAKMHNICTTYRRPFGISMSQPKPGNGGSDTDVIVRGVVGEDGKLYNPLVQSSERPDLNEEALSVVSRWTFAPAMCDGKAEAHEVALTVQFQGR
ncbi:MAG TPA: energy transducer TonB [Terriglobales bacterium]